MKKNNDPWITDQEAMDILENKTKKINKICIAIIPGVVNPRPCTFGKFSNPCTLGKFKFLGRLIFILHHYFHFRNLTHS